MHAYFDLFKSGMAEGKPGILFPSVAFCFSCELGGEASAGHGVRQGWGRLAAAELPGRLPAAAAPGAPGPPAGGRAAAGSPRPPLCLRGERLLPAAALARSRLRPSTACYRQMDFTAPLSVPFIGTATVVRCAESRKGVCRSPSRAWSFRGRRSTSRLGAEVSQAGKHRLVGALPAAEQRWESSGVSQAQEGGQGVFFRSRPAGRTFWERASPRAGHLPNSARGNAPPGWFARRDRSRAGGTGRRRAAGVKPP